MEQSKKYFEKSTIEKQLLSEKAKQKHMSRSKQEKLGISINKAKGQKRRYDTMSESERITLRQRQKDGIDRAAKDPVKKQKRLNNRYDRLKSGFVVHKHLVQTSCGKTVRVWTRGWEYRTIRFLVDVFTEKVLYRDFKIKNDVYIVRFDNHGVFIGPHDTRGIDPSILKAESIYFEEHGVQFRHDLDHHLELHNIHERMVFVDTLVKHFEIDNVDYMKSLIEGKTQVAIETKSFKRAAVQKGVEWVEIMLANAIAALVAESNMVYFVFCWTESSLTFYNVDRQTASLKKLGKTIMFPDTGKDYQQLIKYHKAAFKGTSIACPEAFTTTNLKSAKPIKNGHVDTVGKDRLHITIKQEF